MTKPSETRKLVLIVEDSPMTGEAYALFFESLGHEVLWAPDGEEGLRLARRRTPDLVITDCTMPRMDGLEMAARFRECRALSSVPIVLITALPGGAIPESSKRRFARILHKPLPPGALRRLVESIL